MRRHGHGASHQNEGMGPATTSWITTRGVRGPMRRRGVLGMAIFVFIWSAALAAPLSAPQSIISAIPDVADDEEEAGDTDQQYEDVYAYDGPDSAVQFATYQYGDELADVSAAVAGLFGSLDTNSDGRLDGAELRAGLSAQASAFAAAASDHTAQETAELLASVDLDGDGRLSLAEFEDAETLYLQHDFSITRASFFKFADQGHDGDSGADGMVDASELAGLIFPELSSRAEKMRLFLSEYAVRMHDENRLRPAAQPSTQVDSSTPPYPY